MPITNVMDNGKLGRDCSCNLPGLAMFPDRSVLLFAPFDSCPQYSATDLMGGLQAHGLPVRRYLDMAGLYRATHESLLSYAAVAVILAGLPEQNATMAVNLRATHPRVFLVAMADTTTESQIIQLLHNGADAYCPQQASSALLAAIVFRLLARAGAAAVRPPESSGTPSAWSLQEQGWVLVTPDGKRISLTTGERAFLAALLAAPEKSAPHSVLVAALNAAYADCTPTARPRSLGVTVSRLRRKCTEQGVSMPLQSVHKWGYMFTG
jgi:DNA-binding response OmpR family regulator